MGRENPDDPDAALILEIYIGKESESRVVCILHND